MTFQPQTGQLEPLDPLTSARRADPRALMAQRLPGVIQPFLTWLTARPAPDEIVRDRSAVSFVWEACGCTAAGIAVGLAAWTYGDLAARAVGLLLGWLITTYGLGLFQVVVFHHAAHGTVFSRREANRRAGWLISAILLFKHFDHYRKEHLRHHSANKLLTDEDEFADFVLGMCRLEPGLPKRELWRRVIVNVTVSPAFHARFLGKRLRAALFSADRAHNAVGQGIWLGSALLALLAGQVVPWLLLWVVPVTVLLQVATVGRILCEHRFPNEQLMKARGQDFVCEATAGVFPGSAPPDTTLGSPRGWVRWTGWWLDTIFVQCVVRLFVLVGDAPCHDFHHRRPATRKWPNYIHARQADVDSGCIGYPRNYAESWGLFSALDESLRTLANTSADVLRSGARTPHAG